MENQNQNSTHKPAEQSSQQIPEEFILSAIKEQNDQISSKDQQIITNYQQLRYTKCPTHLNYDITNICVNSQCFEPLCPKCIVQHVQFHNQQGTYAEIELMEEKRDQCLVDVRKIKDIFNQEKSMLNSYNDVSKGELDKRCQQTIQKSKETLYKMIDDYYVQFYDQFQKQIQQHNIINPGQYNQIEEKINVIINSIEDTEKKLQSQQYIKEVISVMSGEFSHDYDGVRGEVDLALEKYCENLYEIFVDENKLVSIQQDLQQFLNLQNVKFDPTILKKRTLQYNKIESAQNPLMQAEKQIEQQSASLSQRQKTNLFQQLFDSPDKEVSEQISHSNDLFTQIQSHNFNQKINNKLEQSQTRQEDAQQSRSQKKQIFAQMNPQDYQLSKGKTEFNNSQTVQLSEMGYITVQDYFEKNCPKKYLHFFQDNSKYFHFIDLDKINRDQKSRYWNIKQIDSDFNIPMFHRSIITPDGKIYLSGGIEVETKKTINKFYQYDVKNSKFDQLCEMKQSRSQHSLIYANNSIFAIGGFSNNDDICLDRCEKYSIELNKWVEIAPLKQKCAGAALAQFQNQYIFKFGGFTEFKKMSNSFERYDISNNNWIQIQLNSQKQEISLDIPAFSGAAFVNSNEILIVGGKYQDKSVDSAYVVKLSEDLNKGIVYQTRNLPKPGQIYSQIIIHGKTYFTLQNVGLEKQPELNNFSKKSLFVFNSKLWKELML